MKKLLSGNEAVARGAYEAGTAVAAAYPGTPSTEILENIASGYPEIYTEWSPNEKVALEVGAGASLAGARTLVSMKHVGVNVAADPLLTLSYTGVNGGLVLISADDPGVHSSQNEQDNRFYAVLAKIPMLEPSDSQEAKDFVILAFAISEEYDTPVMVRLTTRISHSQSQVSLGQPLLPRKIAYKKNFHKYVMIPTVARARHVEVEKRRGRLKEYAEQAAVNVVEQKNSDLGIVASGAAYQYAREALPETSICKLGLTYPLPPELLHDFAARHRRVVVVEELEPFLEDQLKALGIDVEGKSLFPRVGELNSRLVKEKLGQKEQAPSLLSPASPSSLPGRPPVLCAGCPHRGVFYLFHKLKLTVMGDIGCYALGALPPLSGMDAIVCMGASIGLALGMEKAQGKQVSRRMVAVIGDSTFIHSGITSLIDVVYNQGTLTVVILDNHTTAMTGRQHHPSTGRTASGKETSTLDLEKLLAAVGVRRVRITDPYRLKELEQALREELAAEEPSVIIARRPCSLLAGTPREAPLVVDEEACTACGLCRGLGCPALTFKEGKPEINQGQCTGCLLCQQLCSTGAVKKAGEKNEC